MRHLSRYLWGVLIAAGLGMGLPASSIGEDLIGLYLTWNDDPTSTMTINWVDIYPESGETVWYRKRAGGDWQQAHALLSQVGPTSLQLRRVTLRGLEPGTLYEFAIAEQHRRASHYWRFRTLPATLQQPLRFVVGGDMMHTRAMVDTMNRQMQNLDPEFALLLGDFAYADGVRGTRWIDWLQSWREHSVAKGKRIIPLVVGIGNHEVRGHYGGKIPDDAPYFYSLFSLPEDRSYYAFDCGQYLSLIVLDSAHTQPIEGKQSEWLQTALAARKDQQFVIAGYHFPAYGTTKAPPGGEPIDHPIAKMIQQHWVPSFDEYRVTAVFENDHHNFKRTHPLRGHQRDDEHGILYLGDGAWGVRTREVPADGTAWWLARAEPRNHLWHVELRPEGTSTMTAVDAEGEVFDQVDLSSPRPAEVTAAALSNTRTWSPQMVPHTASPLDRALQRILTGARQDQDQRSLAEAWRVIAQAEAADLPKLLDAMDKADAVAAQWLRSGWNASIEQSIQSGHQLSKELLQTVVMDTGRASRTRELVMHEMRRIDPDAFEAIYPKLLHDPVAVFRRPAIDRLLQQAGTPEFSAAEKVALLREAWNACRDESQCLNIKKLLVEAGEPADPLQHLGWITRWLVAGPFTDDQNQPHERVFPPEEQLPTADELTSIFDADDQGEFQSGSLRWQLVTVENDRGELDLNTTLGREKGVAAFAATVIEVPQTMDLEIRLRQQNAFKLWLNGELVVDQPVGHTGNSFDQYIYPVSFRTGKNVLLIKSSQIHPEVEHPFYETWHISARLCDTTGGRIDTLSFPSPRLRAE